LTDFKYYSLQYNHFGAFFGINATDFVEILGQLLSLTIYILPQKKSPFTDSPNQLVQHSLSP